MTKKAVKERKMRFRVFQRPIVNHYKKGKKMLEVHEKVCKEKENVFMQIWQYLVERIRRICKDEDWLERFD